MENHNFQWGYTTSYLGLLHHQPAIIYKKEEILVLSHGAFLGTTVPRVGTIHAVWRGHGQGPQVLRCQVGAPTGDLARNRRTWLVGC